MGAPILSPDVVAVGDLVELRRAYARWIVSAPDGVNADTARGFVSVVLTADDMQDLPAVVARLTKLKVWIDAEPKAVATKPEPKRKPRKPRGAVCPACDGGYETPSGGCLTCRGTTRTP